MLKSKTRGRRRGTVLPLVAASLVGLCGIVALAVDIGMVAVAKNQCQNAADLSAGAGARTLDGSANSNTTAATQNALAAAQANKVLSVAVPQANVTITHGAYHYDTVNQVFTPQYPPVAPDTYNLTKATVTNQGSTWFAQALPHGGIGTFNVSATAVAAHRPRDVAVVLDFSGSMNDESNLYNDVQPAYTYLGTANNTTNNTDSLVPTWGHYSSASANLRYTGSDSRVGLCNITTTVQGNPPIVGDFYQHVRGTTPQAAFTAAPAVYATTPNGDYFLKKNNVNGNTWAVTYQDINNNSTSKNASFDTTATTGGYTYYYNLNSPGATFKGYTQGPGYFGKTFFIWPPDPSKDALGTTRDWRGKFFLAAGGSYPSFGGPLTDNTKLFRTSTSDPLYGSLNDPVTSGTVNYVINYTAILNWIANTGTNPFPTTQLRGGRVVYYSPMPTAITQASAYDWTQANSSITDVNQRFWKEYIDFVLGVWKDPYGNVHHPGDQGMNLVPDFQWGTIQVTSKPSTTYMNYADNPKRPAHRFWFGPMTMVQYLSNAGLLPGTAHDISMYPAKLGVSAALQDIQNNHPNNLVSLILYNRPTYANDYATGIGTFNNAIFSLSRDYQGMINALWYPPNSSVTDVLLYDSNGTQTPRASNDYIYNTAISYGLMLAYNQFSANATLQAQTCGGLGRKGAQRLVILETDGIANVDSIPANSFVNGGSPTNSYYPIQTGQSVNTSWSNIGSSYNPTLVYQAAQSICNLANGTPVSTGSAYSPNPGYPGFSTASKPVLIHTIAFGAMFEPNATGADQSAAVSLLQQVSTIGGTVFPSSSTDPTNGYKWCIGSEAQRQQLLQQAFSTIMDNGTAISLVQ